MERIFLTSLVVYILCIFIKTNKSLQMLQQNRYNRGNKYLKWLKTNLRKNYLSLELLIVKIPFLKFNNLVVLPLIFNTIYFVVAFTLDRKYNKEQTKVPLNFTARILRLYITTILLYVLLVVVFMFIFNTEHLNIYSSFNGIL